MGASETTRACWVCVVLARGSGSGWSPQIAMFGGVVACNMTNPSQLLSTLSSLHQSSKPSDPLSLCLELRGVGTDKTGGKAAGNESRLWTWLRTNTTGVLGCAEDAGFCVFCFCLLQPFLHQQARHFLTFRGRNALITRTLSTVMPDLTVYFYLCCVWLVLSTRIRISQLRKAGHFESVWIQFGV